ncbi:hypothetical protein [Gloeothece verrucosa]|uniref:Uncharacterized protein n=1 Tax=Gloeothece verrucosa (strain PCC 7822) TaxID=497965 RepID=E0U9G0_GLOV7|nr:hypothetical protein [Gloeothece verrucosa]ADN12652.1 hypothetical protein Cyan7822_0616 [Gloeothece verrucosa PCC 7822]
MTNSIEVTPSITTDREGDDKYYQILIVTPRPGVTEPKNINVKIVTKTKKDFSDKGDPLKGAYYYLDLDKNNNKTIGDDLPSNGLAFADGFIKTMFPNSKDGTNTEITAISNVNNLYITTRSLYITRKISQLLAKSWYAYLEATNPKNSDIWKNFVNGNWANIDLKILDGLIIREILLFDSQYSPDNYEFNKEEIKMMSKGHSNTFILPTSKAWQGICLSLLLGGQVYYEMGQYQTEYYQPIGEGTTNNETQENPKITKEGVDYALKSKYYHRVSQPILSTFEMVARYTIEVSRNRFEGEIQELQISPNQTNSIFKAIIPYPPIPSERNLSIEDIEKWAYAEDDEDDQSNETKLPFYDKDQNDRKKYNLNVKYVSPPFPYLPLSTT